MLKLNAYVHSGKLATPQEDSSIDPSRRSQLVARRAGTPFDNELSQTVRVRARPASMSRSWLSMGDDGQERARAGITATPRPAR